MEICSCKISVYSIFCLHLHCWNSPHHPSPYLPPTLTFPFLSSFFFQDPHSILLPNLYPPFLWCSTWHTSSGALTERNQDISKLGPASAKKLPKEERGRSWQPRRSTPWRSNSFMPFKVSKTPRKAYRVRSKLFAKTQPSQELHGLSKDDPPNQPSPQR